MPEVNKARVILVDLTASMMFIMLLKDLQEVPGGTHGWMYSCHGWAILFLQVHVYPLCLQSPAVCLTATKGWLSQQRCSHIEQL